MFGGQPNVLVGTLWCAALFVLAGCWAVSGRVVVPWPFLAAAAASVLVGCS